MSAQIINGKEIALQLRKNITSRVEDIKKKFNITPTLAVIMVGNDPASEVYVGNKEKSAHAVGMNSIQFKLSADISETDLIAKIEELNNDKNVHGILVQLPLPIHIDAKKVIHKINYNKDVDGFNVVNVGKLSIGEVEGVDKAMIPCTPLGCIHLLKFVKGPLNFPSISTNPVSGFIFHTPVGSLAHLPSNALSKALICLGFNFPDQLGSSISNSLQIFP
jgi:methylenetetrahydrofolate dehydrogenase (NADP+)/methenyltetrahydrofolate cyclohydrolase